MKTTFTYDHLLRYDELKADLEQLAADYPQYCRMKSLTKTEEGRDVWCMEITDYSTGEPGEKPAYYVDGCFHAGEVTGLSCALHFADYLITNAPDGETGSVLKTYAAYVIPCVSPDGVEYYYDHPETLRSVDRMYPSKQTPPGLNYGDVDGDGVSRQMRVKSPYGVWKLDPDDPRMMIYREPDETEGEFYNVYAEGFIQDFNGLDVPKAKDKFEYDFNRSFPTAWVPESSQRGAGDYPLYYPETKCIADFVLAHPNICTVMTYHTKGGNFVYPPGYKPASEAEPEDMNLYREICRVGVEETNYTPAQCYTDFTVGGSYGTFDDWCHFDRGIPAITVETWDAYVRAGVEPEFPRKNHGDNLPKEKEIDQLRKLLKWTDENLGPEVYKPWTKCVHPQLGEVEIGGYDFKYVFQNCPPKFLPEECEKTTRFMFRNMKMLPHVVVDDVKVEKVSDGVYKVEAIVGNRGYYSTNLTKEAVKLKVNHPVKVSLEGDFEMVDGKKTVSLGDLAGFIVVHSYFGRLGLCTDTHPSQQKKAVWIIKANEGEKLTVKSVSTTGGTDSVEIVL